jgi:predicted dehydrogenase
MRRSNFTLITMSQLLKVAVVGVGHLGKWHADKYAAATDCDLVAVVDSDAENARDIAPKNGAEAFSDYRDIIPLVDAASPVLPTSLHYKIAGKFLEAGIHCLVEKMFADTAQADLPITETTASRCLSFPIFPEMTEALCAAMLGTR